MGLQGAFPGKTKIFIYLILFFTCVFLFDRIHCSYLNNCCDKGVHAIDLHFWKKGKIDPGFIRESKSVNYNHAGYFKTFFILDTAFIIIYTILFLSIASVFPHSRYFNFSKRLFFIGAGLDFLENFLFAWYLTHNADSLPVLISTVTALKTIVYAHNLLISIIGLGIMLVNFFKLRST